MLATLVRGDAISLYLISSAFRFLGIGIAATYFTLFAFTDLGVSVGDTALAMALAGGLLRIVLALPAGLVADRWNRKHLLIGASIGAVAVHLATALAVSDLAGLYAVLAAGALVGTLGVARIDWADWARFIAKFMLVLFAGSTLFVVAAVLIGYS